MMELNPDSLHLHEGQTSLTVPGLLAIQTNVPQFVWKCIRKIESDPNLMVTEGIYRIPGDASKIQKIRLDIDQVNNI